MFTEFGRSFLIGSTVFMFTAFTTFLAFGGAILLLPLIAFAAASLVFLDRKVIRASIWNLKSSAKFRRLESVARKMSVPTLISHRDSTEIVYANEPDALSGSSG
jgi:hypothetical protein